MLAVRAHGIIEDAVEGALSFAEEVFAFGVGEWTVLGALVRLGYEP